MFYQNILNTFEIGIICKYDHKNKHKNLDITIAKLKRITLVSPQQFFPEMKFIGNTVKSFGLFWQVLSKYL